MVASTVTTPTTSVEIQKLIDPTRPIDASPFIIELMLANGRTSLAAERLKVSEAQLVFEIARDPDSQRLIDQYLRLYTSIKTFQMLGEAQLVLMKTVASLEPAQASKHFIGLLTAIESLTRRSPQQTTNNLNLFEAAIKKLPPEVTDALKLLATEKPQTDEEYNEAVAKTSPRLEGFENYADFFNAVAIEDESIIAHHLQNKES